MERLHFRGALGGQFRAQTVYFLFLTRQLGAQLGQFLLLVLLEMPERLAFLVAVHGVALHQDFEVDQ